MSLPKNDNRYLGNNTCLLPSLLMLIAITTHASPVHDQDQALNQCALKQLDKEPQKKQHFIPKFSYSYIDINFNSYADSSYNIYYGSSNVYSAGIDNLQLNPKTFAGIYGFQINSKITSNTYLFPNAPIYTLSTISSNTLFGHILRKINQNLAVDIFGSMGQNNSTINNVVFDDEGEFGSYLRKIDQAYMAGLTGSYTKAFQRLRMTFSAGGLYNLINSGQAYSNQTPGYPPVRAINPLVTRSGIFFENIQLSLPFNNQLTPFVSGGLVQVPYYTNSRPIYDPAYVTGPVPQVLMNQNAFRLGAGFTIVKRHYVLRLEQKYYNSAHTLVTNTTTATLSYRFS